MLGYCVFPLSVAAVLVKLFGLFGLKGLTAFIIDFIVATVSFVWAVFGKSVNKLYFSHSIFCSD